jgi:predicted phage terminase large subunit-like protein
LKYISDKELAEVSLYEFLRQAWSIIEGGTEFVDEWYLESIADSLQDCYNRKIKKLLVNLPPQKGKSNLISIAFPAWVWIHNPQERFYCASYTKSLALKLADKSKLIIKSDWYQKNWGHLFKIRKDKDSGEYFVNNRTGFRKSTSAGSFVTGEAGTILIVDDPNDPDGQSEADLQTVNNWWYQKFYNRVNNPVNAVRIVVQQRSQSTNDISGNIIAGDVDNEWTKYILPMEYESSIKSDFKDQRTIEGELLSVRDTAAIVKDLKRNHGSYGYAAQYQQRPAPLEGGIIKKYWFKLHKTDELPNVEYVLQSWDTALTGKDDSSYSACTTWGVFKGEHGNRQVILLSMWRGRIEYPELRQRVKRLALDYMDIGDITPRGYNYYRKPDVILIEAKASGDPLIADLNRASIYAVPFVPNKYGDKVQRVRLVTPLIESGCVFMPTKDSKLTTVADEFVNSVSYFPNTDSRDLVDTMTQALIRLKQDDMLRHPEDKIAIKGYKETIESVY